MTHFSSPQLVAHFYRSELSSNPQLMAGSICSLGGGMIVSLVQPVGDEDYDGESMVNLASMENQLEVIYPNERAWPSWITGK